MKCYIDFRVKRNYIYSCSTKFLVTNGVKQGGILSPSLFSVCMNNLSLSLNHSGIEGSLGDNLINHLCYKNNNKNKNKFISEQKIQFDDNEILLINVLLETHTMGTTAIT